MASPPSTGSSRMSAITTLAPSDLKSGDLGSPIGQEHLLRSQLAKVRGDNFRRFGSKGLSDLTIGDCRFGSPILWTLPTTAFLVTPNLIPI